MRYTDIVATSSKVGGQEHIFELPNNLIYHALALSTNKDGYPRGTTGFSKFERVELLLNSTVVISTTGTTSSYSRLAGNDARNSTLLFNSVGILAGATGFGYPTSFGTDSMGNNYPPSPIILDPNYLLPNSFSAGGLNTFGRTLYLKVVTGNTIPDDTVVSVLADVSDENIPNSSYLGYETLPMEISPGFPEPAEGSSWSLNFNETIPSVSGNLGVKYVGVDFNNVIPITATPQVYALPGSFSIVRNNRTLLRSPYRSPAMLYSYTDRYRRYAILSSFGAYNNPTEWLDINVFNDGTSINGTLDLLDGYATPAPITAYVNVVTINRS